MSSERRPLVVLDIVGLTPNLLTHMPRLSALARSGFRAELGTVLPAVTCSVQATLLTGTLPREHGIVGNGWYFRDLSEVWLWRQSNRLVAGEKFWETARNLLPEEDITCAKMFWWYNMYSSADWSATPRPVYYSNGAKAPGIYTHPHDLKYELTGALGEFPLFNFWGPTADIVSSRWIAEATRMVFDKYAPTITLCYLPHLDYDLQRYGGSGAHAIAAAQQMDEVAGNLIDPLRAAGAKIVVLSEYGITNVSRPVDINRRLREAGLLEVVHNDAGELLDAGASRAFAVADHQVAHVYTADASAKHAAREALSDLAGVDRLLDDESGTKSEAGLDHPRAGELIAIAEPDSWFTYYYWLDDDRAPDFARSVDIHKKPGYDPAELFFDGPNAKLRAAVRLAQKKLGFRYRMDVVPVDASRVAGSHGRLPADPGDGPVLICSEPEYRRDAIEATQVYDLLLELVGVPTVREAVA